MSALNLLRAYRYPQLAAAHAGELTPEAFLDGRANTIYVVAAGHDQDALRPVILALRHRDLRDGDRDGARATGALDPRLFILMDEAANIAPVRNLASVAFAVRRPRHRDRDDLAVDRADRPALRPRGARRDLRSVHRPGIHPAAGGADERRLPHRAAGRGAGRERVQLGGAANAQRRTQKAGAAPWLRQIPRGRAILIYRDLPPAVVRAPGWFEDPRFASGELGSPPSGERSGRELSAPASDMRRMRV